MKIDNMQTLKGFRDFLPEEAGKRAYIISLFKKVFELYGFEPLETPALEYESILIGKYGPEADKLMYRFEDNGKRRVALRYDQTVPLARVVAQYQNSLPMPFKRYQIQPVWRAENTQKGRFREFLQCDIDSVGVNSLFADAEIIAIAAKSLEALGFDEYEILINDRKLFRELNKDGLISDTELPKAIRSLDKIRKVGEAGVIDDMVKNGFSKKVAESVVENAKKLKENDDLLMLFSFLDSLDIARDKFIFAPQLARGIDYYTGMIFEIIIPSYDAGSVCGGGRYDNLIGSLAGKSLPAVGFSFGFDRVYEAMSQRSLFPKNLSETKVMITVFSNDLARESIALANKLRSSEINTEIYLDWDERLDKQLKYTDKKNIPFAIILGPEEIKMNVVKLKDMKTGQQETLVLDKLISKLKNAS